MPPNLEIIVTGDGSHTIRDTSLDVTYHSLHGAIAESRHVFIEHGLRHLYREGKSEFDILEIGFGTGLNALLSWEFATENNCPIRYTSLEPFPIPGELARNLNYPALLPGITEELFKEMHSGDAQDGLRCGDHFTLGVWATTFDEWKSNDRFDLVYLDAFGPKAAPELWSVESLGKLKSLLLPGSALVTFCAQGQFKRDLKALGFVVSSLPGPPGKREMVRATLGR